MPTSDPVTVLLTQDRWATGNLLQSCTTITHEQFHQPFDMGPGSLHNTTTHILGAHRGWTDVLIESPEPRIRLEEGDRTAQELLDLHQVVADEFEAAVKAHPHDTIVTPSYQGRAFSFTRGGILTHVTTHAMHHRAQCLNMLRQLGIETLPPNSVLEWMLTADH